MLLSLQKVVSGGQSGADRAALDWAIARGVAHEGWCPAARRAEDGPIDDSYLLKETPTRGYITRTRWNIRDADATVIFSIAEHLTGGSRATWDIAKQLGKPVIHLSRAVTQEPSKWLRQFVDENFVATLNIAGPRASGEPEVGEYVQTVLDDAFLEDISTDRGELN